MIPSEQSKEGYGGVRPDDPMDQLEERASYEAEMARLKEDLKNREKEVRRLVTRNAEVMAGLTRIRAIADDL